VGCGSGNSIEQQLESCQNCVFRHLAYVRPKDHTPGLRLKAAILAARTLLAISKKLKWLKWFKKLQFLY